MTLNVLIAMLIVFLGGAAIAIQAPINARLAHGAGGTLLAATVSFGIGFILLAGALLISTRLPSAQTLAALPWWIWIGGLLGAFYVVASIWAVPQIGVLTMVASVILGQMTAALLLDATGAFGLEIREISWTRLLAVLFVISGLILSKL